MSFLSGREGRLAAMRNAYTAQSSQQQIDALLRNAQGSGENALTGARADQLLALGQGYNTARSDIGAGGQAALARYDPYAETGLKAFNAQADAAGLGGQEGYDRAFGAFRASPGYQYRVDQAQDQAIRGANVSGQGVLSGNTLTELAKLSGNLADQDYGAYYSRLQGMGDRGFQAANAQAGIEQDTGRAQGQLAYNYGTGQSGVYGDTAARLASLYQGVAGQRGSAQTNLSQQLIDANNQSAKAKEDAEANKVSLIAGLLGLGSKALAFPMAGGSSVGGNLISKIPGFG